MSTIANISARSPAHAGSGRIPGVGRVLRRARERYAACRAQARAAAALRALSDRQLKDIGLSRANIPLAAKGIDVRHRPLDLAERLF